MGPFGAFISRNQTWWDLSRDWITYLARCQYLLQSGSFVADICVYVGESDPQTSSSAFKNLLPPMPKGYDWDYCGPDMLVNMKVRDGRLALPSGMSYRILVLPKTERMSPIIARQIRSQRRDLVAKSPRLQVETQRQQQAAYHGITFHSSPNPFLSRSTRSPPLVTPSSTRTISRITAAPMIHAATSSKRVPRC